MTKVILVHNDIEKKYQPSAVSHQPVIACFLLKAEYRLLKAEKIKNTESPLLKAVCCLLKAGQ